MRTSYPYDNRFIIADAISMFAMFGYQVLGYTITDNTTIEFRIEPMFDDPFSEPGECLICGGERYISDSGYCKDCTRRWIG